MQNLDAIQRWMQSVIMNPHGVASGIESDEARQVIDVGTEQVEGVVTRSHNLTALERLDIYHRAYFSRLIECLRDEFPALVHALGEETFDAFALGYLQKYPSRSYTLNHLGTRFPQHLAETRPPEDDDGPSWPDFLIDLATLELTFGEVFDGRGVEGQPLLGVEQLQALDPEQWLLSRLVPVPCLRLLTARFPVNKYYRAFRKKKEPAIPQPSATYLAITRRQFVVRHYQFPRLQHLLLSALVSGQTVGDAIRTTADAAGPQLSRLAGLLHKWFRNWTAEGFFLALETPHR
jgi:Putative DNA-binding domain